MNETIQQHIVGLGGIFYKCDDPSATRKWYSDILGIKCSDYGAEFPFREDDEPDKRGYSIWGPFTKNTDYFSPSSKEFMINFRVRDLSGLLEKLADQGIAQHGERMDEVYGSFAWILDPDGVKIELWEQKGEPPE